MTTRRFETFTTSVQVTDRDAVQNLINEYRFPIDVEVYFAPDSTELHIKMSRGFLEAYKVDTDSPQEVGLEVPQTPALAEFFTKLSDHIVAGESLVVQLVGIADDSSPLIAVEWRIQNTGVQETAFTFGESTNWTPLPSNHND